MPELMNELNTFSNLSQLKPNTTKSDRMLTNIYCSIQTNFNLDKLLTGQFSYNKNLEKD